MTEQQELFAIRNRLLTKLFLTAHPEVTRLWENQDDLRYMAVRLRGDDEYGLPRFRVYYVGVLAIADSGEANKIAAERYAELAADGDQILPTLLAVYSHKDDRGWITWVTKPGHHDGDTGLLTPLPAPDCRPFDRAAVDEIVRTVKAWRPAVRTGARR